MPSAPRQGLAHLFLLAFLLLAGCTGKLSEADRRACLDLTYAYDTGIPSCDSQESCFSGAAKSLSPDFQQHFNPVIRQRLDEYLNHLALAWLHLNAAEDRLKEINSLCSAANNLSGLREKANDFTNRLSLAAKENDSLGETSAELLEAERAYLLSQDVNLVPDTKLFDDYRALSLNANGFRDKGFQRPPDSYAGLYYAAADRFTELLRKTGYGSEQIKEANALDFAQKYARKIVQFIPVSKVFLPVVGDTFASFAERVTSSLASRDAAALLQEAKPYAFLQALSGFVSPRSSAAKAFTSLFTAASKDTETLAAENQKVYVDALAKLEALNKQLDSLHPVDFTGFDSGTLGALFLALGQPKRLVADDLALGGLDQSLASLQARSKLLAQQLSFALASGKTLGKQTLELRAATRDLDELLARSRSLNEDSLSELAGLCKAKAGLIADQLQSFRQEAKEFVPVLNEEQLLRQGLAAFDNAPAQGRKLAACKRMLDLHQVFERVLQDPQGLELDQQTQANDCLAFTQKALTARKDDLRPLYPAFARLRLLHESNAAPADLAAACQGLRQQISDTLSTLPDVKAARENQAKLAENAAALEGLDSLDPTPESRAKLESYKKALADAQALFAGDGLDSEQALDQLPSVSKSLDTLSGDARREFLQRLQVFLVDHATVALTKPNPFHANTAQESALDLEFFNPFEEVDEPVILRVPLEEDFPSLTPKRLDAAFTKSEPKDHALLLYLKSIPSGRFSAAFTVPEEPVTAQPAHEIQSISLDAAEVETTLVVRAKEPVENLVVSTPLLTPQPPANVRAQSDGFPVPFNLTDSGLELALATASNGQVIRLQYRLPDPLHYALEQTGFQAAALNSTRLEYTLSLENRLPLEVKPPRLALPLPLHENAFQAPQLLDETGRELQYLGFTGQNFAFVPPKLLPGRPTLVQLRLTVNDFQSFWKGVLSGLSGRAQTLAQSPSPTLRAEAGTLLRALQDLAATPDLSARARLPEATALSNQLAALERQDQQFRQDTQDLAGLRQKIEAQLATQQNIVQALADTLFFAPETKQLADARERFNSGLASLESGDLPAALARLREAQSILTHANPFTSLLGAADQFWSDAKEKFKALDSADAQAKLAPALGGLERAHQQFKALVAADDSDSLLQSFASLRQQDQAFLDQAGQALADQAQQLAALRDQVAALTQTVAEKTSLLAGLVKERPAQELAEYGLASIPQKLESLQADLGKLQPKADAGQLPMADAQRKQKALAELVTALDDSLVKVSSTAVARYNSAAALYNAAQKNPDVEDLLSKAKQALQDQAYFEALQSTSAATSLLSFKPPAKPFTVPLPVYPLVLVLALLLFFRLRQQKRADVLPPEQAVERA